MFINFSRIITWIFSSFNIAWDTQLLEKLEKDNVRFVMIIKKHWIYSILMSWRVFIVLAITCANIYLLVFSQPNPDMITMGIAVFLGANVLWWLIVVIIYIRRFRNIQGNKPYIEDIYSAIAKSKLSDTAFENFFNQTILVLIILLGITIFIVFTSIMGAFVTGSSSISFGMGNALLFIIQVSLFYGYLSAMINQEMDFKIVVPEKILFYNQIGVFNDSQSMNAEKIKTINAKHAGIFWAFINYGNIIILTEWDQDWEGEMKMDYVGDPLDTVNELQRVLTKDYTNMEKNVNLLLSRFDNEIGISDVSTPENKEKLRQFVTSHDALLQDIFKNGDTETKHEVRELYTLIQK